MMGEKDVIGLKFFRTASGNEPVREWLKDLDLDARKTVGTDMRVVQIGWPMGMPACRSLGGGLWEVRSNLTDNRIARVLFCFHEGELIALHGFIKKTKKTLDDDLKLARTRMNEVKR